MAYKGPAIASFRQMRFGYLLRFESKSFPVSCKQISAEVLGAPSHLGMTVIELFSAEFARRQVKRRFALPIGLLREAHHH
jgi:hypothetical protein